MWELEENLYASNINVIAGVDEAGRGPLAGPVVAAAVIVPRNYKFKQKIADSKKLSAHQRQLAFEEISQTCCFAYAVISESQIDKDNILKATLSAMADAVSKLEKKPQWVLVDGTYLPNISCSGSAIIDGDAKSISIACASIIAKVIRDNIMIEYDKIYPVYGFAKHKGYGTKAHRLAIIRHGPCTIHRQSFRPVKTALHKTTVS